MEAVDNWLIVTAKHMAINIGRKGRREVLRENVTETGETDPASVSPEEEFISRLRKREYRELAETIFTELFRVNERWYDAILLTYFLEKPQKEVADVMGISLENLHSTLYRARQWIRKHYEEQFQHLNKA